MTDFTALAQVARPQMMGNAPSPIAGALYGRQLGNYENFLAQAAEEAKVRAAMEAMKAEEFALGAPGRRAKSALEAETNTAQLEDFRANGREDMMRERAMKELKAAEPLLNAIAAAKDENEVAEILKNAGQFGNTKIRGKDLSTLDPKQAKKLADFYIKGQTQTPKHRAEMEKETVKAGTRTALAKFTAEEKAKLSIKLQEMRNTVASAKAAQAAGKPLTASQAEAMAVEEMYGDDEEGKLKYWMAKAYASRGPGEQAKAETGKNLGLPVTAPEPLTLPPSNKQGPSKVSKPKNTSEPHIGAMWNDGTKEQKIVNVGRKGGKVVAIKLEDGTVVDLTK